MTDPIEKLRKLVEAATPGPWRKGWTETTHVFCPATHADRMSDERNLLRMNPNFPGEADAALIAAMRNALPLLLDLVEAADRVRHAGTYVPPEYGTGPTEEAADYDTKRAALASALEER